MSAWTQYIPGQITQSFDTVNKNFVIDIAPATPVDNMVTEDGWGKVYILKILNFMIMKIILAVLFQTYLVIF